MLKTHPLTAGAILISMLSALPPAQAEGLRSITHEDVWLMKRAGSPEVSPDGRWIAFALEQPAYDDDAKSSDIWLVPTDGSAPARQLTQTKGTEGDLAWSPDSTRLAFTTRREGDEAEQVYVLDLAAGGEARRVTDLAGGAEDPVWRPRRRALLVTTMVIPRHEAGQRYGRRRAQGTPVQRACLRRLSNPPLGSVARRPAPDAGRAATRRR